MVLNGNAGAIQIELTALTIRITEDSAKQNADGIVLITGITAYLTNSVGSFTSPFSYGTNL
ncbi:MAG: hypothetical protein P8L36_17885 [SAR324 cluster bacterium]|nr:hypothetical protein [SAR324 cluster bacterium]